VVTVGARPFLALLYRRNDHGIFIAGSSSGANPAPVSLVIDKPVAGWILAVKAGVNILGHASILPSHAASI
jgi:hypothetical protein